MRFPSVVVDTWPPVGVGRATARELARRGAGVMLLARDSEGLQTVAREVEAVGALAAPELTEAADG
jgi:NADP-dependent 3-hydroxy acid dehydrogenase YdfG